MVLGGIRSANTKSLQSWPDWKVEPSCAEVGFRKEEDGIDRSLVALGLDASNGSCVIAKNRSWKMELGGVWSVCETRRMGDVGVTELLKMKDDELGEAVEAAYQRAVR